MNNRAAVVIFNALMEIPLYLPFISSKTQTVFYIVLDLVKVSADRLHFLLPGQKVFYVIPQTICMYKFQISYKNNQIKI